MISTRIAFAAVLVLPLLAPQSAVAAGKDDVTTQYGPAASVIQKSDKTYYFALTNGVVGAQMSNHPRAQGIDWKQFMNGAAYAMRYTPESGPDCNKDGKGDGSYEFWSIDSDPKLSRLAVNPYAKMGVVFIRGATTHYVQTADFCESKKFSAGAKPAPGFIYMPFAAQGWSTRNFTATALRAKDKKGSTLVGLFSGGDATERLGPYLAAGMLGQSQALAEGPGGATTAAMLQQYGQAGPAAEAIKNMPGLVPGANSQGWLELHLADKPATEIAGKDTPFFFLHLRAVHTQQEVTPGRDYESLQALVRDSGAHFYDPATPNGK